MESTRTEKIPPPPGIISSIKAGFDAIAARITVILLPLLLDLFLWLGPRLRMDAIIASMKDLLESSPETIAAVNMENWPEFEKAASNINLFRVLRTFPIGVSGLLRPEQTPITPLGAPFILQVDAWNIALWVFMLILAGWIGGALYFRSVAWLATAAENTHPVRISHAILQTVLISIIWLVFLILIGFPLFLVLSLLLQVSEFLVNILVLLLSLVSIWVIVPLFFWPHGVFIKRQNFVTSIISSIQMARFTLPTSSMFILTVFLLSMGLNYLWSIPEEKSWVTLFGIFGHAFVSTALLAGSFIYYRDMNAWLQNVIERLKSNTPRQA
jgi:hypothetical protein